MLAAASTASGFTLASIKVEVNMRINGAISLMLLSTTWMDNSFFFGPWLNLQG